MRSLLLTLAASLLLAAPATATVRYAAPNSADAAGACSTPAAACTLTHAINDAPVGSEVVLASGAYSVSATLDVPDGGYVHGPAGGPRPVITSSQPNASVRALGNGGGPVHLADFEVVGVSGFAGLLQLDSSGALIERLVLRDTATNGLALNEADTSGTAVVRDTIATATGTNAVALSFDGQQAKVRNVTAFATGAGSIGILSRGDFIDLGMGQCFGQGYGRVDVRSSIAHGETSDIALRKSGSCGPSPTLSIGWSAFVTKAEVGGAVIDLTPAHNIAAAPVAIFPPFSNAFHERSDSPTIDAGTADASTGTTDVDGLPRVVGQIDMGASEYGAQAPAAPAAPAGGGGGGGGAPAAAPDAAPDGTPAATAQVDAPPVAPVAVPTVQASTVRCTVPSLTGLSRSAAKRRLARAHCALGHVKGKRSGKVRRQTQARGRTLRAGSHVDIRLG